jgi:hypothetical protein
VDMDTPCRWIRFLHPPLAPEEHSCRIKAGNGDRGWGRQRRTPSIDSIKKKTADFHRL